MKFDILHNFISPVTGRILADFNYVLVGNRQGIAIPSPILIDIRLDLINLRKRYNTLTEADFVIGFPNSEIPNAQVLSNLANGFVYNTEGIISTLPTVPQIPLCYTATTENLTAIYNNGDSGIGATLTYLGLGTFTIDDQAPPVNSIILVKDQSSSYENGIYTVTNIGSTITPWILTRLGIYDQPMKIQAGDIVAVEYGTINAQTLWVETQTVESIGTDPILFIPFSLFNTLPENNIWIGNDMNKPIPHPTIALNNLPDLTTEYIWRGVSGKPVAVNDLTILEGKVAIIEDDIVIIEGKIAVLEIQVAANTADIILINGELIILEATVAGLVAAVATNTANIIILFNRTLNEVPLATDDVDINGHKLINVSNPSNGLDAVNLDTLESYVSGLDVELVDFVIGGPAVGGIITTSRGPTCTLDVIPATADVSFYDFKLINLADADLENPTEGVNVRTLGNVIDATELILEGDVTGTGALGSPIETELQLTLDQIKLAQNTVDLNDQKIINLKSDDVAQLDALNAKFLWDLMHDNVGVVWV